MALHNSMYYNSESVYSTEWNQIMDQLVSNYGINRSEFALHHPPVDWDFITQRSKNDLLSFQSHGISHQPVVALSEKELRNELLESKTKIFERTQKEVSHFCYPYGGKNNIGSTAGNIVKDYYKSAVTMERGRIDGDMSPYFLPRIPLYEIDSVGRTLLKTLTK
jgi:peptidoglycan/xylan/chitin deacetylase (PgdA/CDA1 family)